MESKEYTSLMTNRENLYRFLEKIYRQEPNKVFLEQLRNIVFPIDSDSSAITEGYRLVSNYLKGNESDIVTDLAVDYAKVFLAAGSNEGFAALPYESVYTGKKKIVMQDAWEKVREIYSTEGLIVGNVESHIFEDHIALELEFMAFLCKKAGNDPDSLELIEKQKDFLNQHLLNWVPKFCADIETYAKTEFYKGIARITKGFLEEDRILLESLIAAADEKMAYPLTCSLSNDKMDQVLQELQKDYKIYAPKLHKNRGANRADLVRYGEISSVKEIVIDAQSDFSPKEVYYPISQTMFYFKDGASENSILEDSKGIIIFARPCDINSMESLDMIFLLNGGTEDVYYKRLRDKVKFFMIECTEGFEDCFCVSMGSNKTENYSLAVRFSKDRLLLEVKDPEFDKYFCDEESVDFKPEFPINNRKKVNLPKIDSRETLKLVNSLEFWKEYDEKCIGCGGCNTVCGTCSCFDTIDIIYNETSKDGERKRVWSSCMLDSYTKTAGGAKFRKSRGANMRFKVLHKVYDFKARFGGDRHMCVGCGRCDRRCPKDISYFDAINRLSSELEKASDTVAEEVGRS